MELLRASRNSDLREAHMIHSVLLPLIERNNEFLLGLLFPLSSPSNVTYARR